MAFRRGMHLSLLPPCNHHDVDEVPLRGGTLTTVVRVGGTVRRQAGPWTPAVQDLLRHVRARGFGLAPEPLGTDDQGREVLGYIDGETCGWDLPWPPWAREEQMLLEVGSALAAYHRAVADYRPAGDLPWQGEAGVLTEGPVICHNDFAPYNAVVRDGRLVGIIDWDQAGPGAPLSDLAFVAWQWVPLHGPFVTSLLGWAEPPDRRRRLTRLLDAYGLEERAGFIGAVEERIRLNRAGMLQRAAEGHPGYQALVDQGHVAGMDEALAFLAEEGPALGSAL